MKKTLKRVVALLLTGAMACSLAACGGGSDAGESSSESGTAVKGKDCTIGVAFYQDTGLSVDATKVYLKSLSDTLNAEFKYTVLTQTDEAANLTKVQELISSGVDGIISTMDLGTTSIIQECEAAGIYYGGYLSDFDTSYNTSYDKVFKNEYFVGTVSDGPCTDAVTGGQVFSDSLIAYNERNKETPITHVSMAIFPAWAFPSQAIIAQQFVDAIDEHNKTTETPITVNPLDEKIDVLNFAPLDSTYFAKHPDSQAIMSFAAGTAFVYPTMVSTGVDKSMKLFTTGFDGGEEVNFGSAGTGTYQQTIVSAPEAITYPLVLLLNKINGAEFTDKPENAERLSSSQLIVNSDETLEKFKTSLYYTGDAGNALYTPEEVLNMTAYANPDATYKNLSSIVTKMTIDDLK